MATKICLSPTESDFDEALTSTEKKLVESYYSAFMEIVQSPSAIGGVVFFNIETRNCSTQKWNRKNKRCFEEGHFASSCPYVRLLELKPTRQFGRGFQGALLNCHSGKFVTPRVVPPSSITEL